MGTPATGNGGHHFPLYATARSAARATFQLSTLQCCCHASLADTSAIQWYAVVRRLARQRDRLLTRKASDRDRHTLNRLRAVQSTASTRFFRWIVSSTRKASTPPHSRWYGGYFFDSIFEVNVFCFVFDFGCPALLATFTAHTVLVYVIQAVECPSANGAHWCSFSWSSPTIWIDKLPMFWFSSPLRADFRRNLALRTLWMPESPDVGECHHFSNSGRRQGATHEPMLVRTCMLAAGLKHLSLWIPQARNIWQCYYFPHFGSTARALLRSAPDDEKWRSNSAKR